MQGEPSFTLSGSVYNGSVYNQGSAGYFWSSSVMNANRAAYLRLNSSDYGLEYKLNEYYGFSVRCMAQ